MPRGIPFKDSVGIRGSSFVPKHTATVKGKSIQFKFNGTEFHLKLPDREIKVTKLNAHNLAIWIMDKISTGGIEDGSTKENMDRKSGGNSKTPQRQTKRQSRLDFEGHG